MTILNVVNDLSKLIYDADMVIENLTSIDDIIKAEHIKSELRHALLILKLQMYSYKFIVKNKKF